MGWFKEREPKVDRKDALYRTGMTMVKLRNKAHTNAINAQDMGGGKKLVSYYLGQEEAYRQAVAIIQDALNK